MAKAGEAAAKDNARGQFTSLKNHIPIAFLLCATKGFFFPFFPSKLLDHKQAHYLLEAKAK